MLSAVIPSERSKPAVLLAEQLAHQRFVRPGPLVLGTAPLKSPARAADRDRTVSRRSKPSSRTALMGEQPNPWDLLQPQDATIRHRACLHHYWWRRLYLHPARKIRARGRRLIGAVNLFAFSRTGASISSLLAEANQSLRGHDEFAIRQTSHGIVLVFSPKTIGVHRYKPEL